MNNGWGTPGPVMGGAGQQQEPVILLIAAPVESGKVTTWVSGFQIDSRFSVKSFATDANDLSSKMSISPEVVIIDAQIFNGPKALIDFITKVQGAAYVVLPLGVDESVVGSLRGLSPVKGVFLGDININEVS